MTMIEKLTGDPKDYAPYIRREYEIVGTLIQAMFDAGLPYDQEETELTHFNFDDEIITLVVDGKDVFRATVCWRGRSGSIDIEETDFSEYQWKKPNGEATNQYRYSWYDEKE